MASIVTRGKSISVVYYVNGKPKWEACKTKEEAKKRKLEVEYKQSKGTFVAPSKMTVEDLMNGLSVLMASQSGGSPLTKQM